MVSGLKLRVPEVDHKEEIWQARRLYDKEKFGGRKHYSLNRRRCARFVSVLLFSSHFSIDSSYQLWM